MTTTPQPIPAERLQERQRQAAERLAGGVMVLPGAPVRYRSRDTEYPHRPDSELYWLTGLTEPGAVAVLRGGADPALEIFVRPRDPEAELWSGARLGPDGAAEVSGADAAHPLPELGARLAALLDGAAAVHFRLGAHPEVEPLVVEGLRRARARGARKGTGPRAVVDPGEILDELRLRKDDWELARIREAARITQAGFRALQARLVPGVPEHALQATLEAVFREEGGEGPAYESIVGSGPNACVLHYVENRRVVQAGDLVLVDAGASFGWYAGDITRTYPAAGAFTPGQRDLYRVVEEARAAAVEQVRPGVTVGSVHDVAVGILTRGLVELGILEGEVEALVEAEAHKPFFPHQTSHWLGLDVHDVGDYARDGDSRILEPGMVLTVEPGLYFGPGAMEAVGERGAAFRGMGIRIEDDILVTGDGRENLTAALPSSLEEVEAAFRGA
ncbi:MAG TPA: aminopeptidase P N-terminal domain-containing protein [Longimicrobiales bacterium]|nr:aminopeptidase P N-terminal domain-containing protein [Longimicrobiales bacterium]